MKSFALDASHFSILHQKGGGKPKERDTKGTEALQ